MKNMAYINLRNHSPEQAPHPEPGGRPTLRVVRRVGGDSFTCVLLMFLFLAEEALYLFDILFVFLPLSLG